MKSLSQNKRRHFSLDFQEIMNEEVFCRALNDFRVNHFPFSLIHNIDKHENKVSLDFNLLKVKFSHSLILLDLSLLLPHYLFN